MNGLFTQQILPWLRRTGTTVPTLLLAFFVSLPAQAVDDPEGLQFTLTACRQEAGDVIPSGDPLIAPLCEDGAYTTGNLGKLWAELDLVPHRLTLTKQRNDPDQTYRIVVSGDRELGEGLIGWDNITIPVINDGKSADSCAIVDVGPVSIAAGPVGGVDSIVYRYIDIQHDADTTCVLDYAQRLSITAAGFSGSSLQSQLLKQDLSSIGQRTLSLPVADILPQEISKEMTATQDIDNDWNVQKSITPTVFDFGDTCDPDNPLSQDVTVKVEWTKTPTPGGVHVQTVVTATNPSSRDVLIRVTDTIYDGITELDEVDTGIMPGADIDGFVLLPANSMVPILVHEFDAPAGVTALNDKAVAEYKDPIFNDVTIPTDADTATASAEIEQGDTFNDTATIVDTETIFDNEGVLSFSVDPVALGTFDGYIPGDKATTVVWNSGVLSSSGEVYFDKTVYIDGPAIVTDGKLTDLAVLTSGEGETQIVRKAYAKTQITSGATVELTIYKSLSEDVLQDGESATFNFEVKSGTDVVDSGSIMLSGTSTGSTTVSGLPPGSYDVLELATTGFTTAVNPQPVTINLPNCEGQVSFINDPIEPKARVKKVTFPAGSESGWEFTLWKDDVQIEGPLATDASGELNFTTMLGEGNYEVKETVQDNWQLTGVTDPRNDDGNKVCTFTVDLPDDYNGVGDSGYFTCTFENTQDARVLIRKEVKGASYLNPNGTFNFEGDLGNFAISTSAFDTPVDSPDGYVYVTPRTEPYLVSELDPSATLFSFTGVSCTDSVVSNSGQVDQTPVAAIRVEPGEEVVCTFVNTKLAAPGRVVIRKITQGGIGEFDFQSNLENFSLTTLQEGVAVEKVFEPISAGLYQVEELDAFDSVDGFDLINLQCDDPNEVDDNTTSWNGVDWDGTSPDAAISVDDGETVTCTFTNRKRGKIIVDKVANPSDTGMSFEFSPSYADNFFLKHGEENDSGWLVPGSYNVKELVPDGWDLTQVMCRPENGDTSALLVPEVPNPNPVSVNLNAGEVIRCTFTNVQRFMIDLQKYFNGIVRSDLDIGFKLYEGPDGFGGTELASDTTLGDGDGLLEFGSIKLEAMAAYTVCEIGIPVGTTANWFLDTNNDGVGDVDLNAMVYNPDGDNVPPEDLGNRCLDFGFGTATPVDPGDTLHLVVNNDRPEGDRRTPGYWKNWNTCTNGNQVETAAKNGGPDEGFWLLDDLLPISVDGVLVDNCETGVAILDSRSTKNGKKMANYADFTLARALLAAKLNVKAGASTCNGDIQAVIDQADALLTNIGYSPASGKLRPNSPYYQDAIYLAGILDDYNNNQCNINGN